MSSPRRRHYLLGREFLEAYEANQVTRFLNRLEDER